MLLLFILCGSLCEAKEKICLSMMVKNQADTVKATLHSVKELIDSWVIVDLGSTDGTQEMIRGILEGVPGELCERPWRSSADNRTEALKLAKLRGGYLLLMEPGDILELDKGFAWPPLDKDLYLAWHGTRNAVSLKPLLVKADLPVKWVGITHEYLDYEQSCASQTLPNIHCYAYGGRVNGRDEMTAWRNVRLLEDAMKKEPQNGRNAFYLAESYRDAGEKGKALECYQRRIQMGGYDEEVFCSLLQVGHMLSELNLPAVIVAEAYKQAHAFRPHRAEPVYYLSCLYNNQGNYKQAYVLLKDYARIPKPSQKDVLFNQEWIEKHGLLFQLSICSYYVGKYAESLHLCDQLLGMEQIPDMLRKQIETNRTFSLTKLE